MKCHYWCLVWYCCDGLSENAKCLEHLVIWCQIWWFGARSGDLVPNLVILCQIWWSEPNIPWDLNQPIEQRCDLPGDKDATNMIQALTQIFFWFGIVPLCQQLQATNFQPEKLYWASPEPDILSWYIRWHQWHVNTVLTIFIFYFLPLLKSLRYLRGWGE